MGWERGDQDWGCGNWGCGTRDAGSRDVELGVVGLGDMGHSDPWRLGDLINKPDFCAEFVKYNFWWSLERYNMLESLSVVANDFQHLWFGQMCLLTCLTVRTLGTE